MSTIETAPAKNKTEKKPAITNISGSVEVIFNGPVTYSSSLGLPPTSVSGDTITWSIADFSLVNPITDFNINIPKMMELLIVHKSKLKILLI